jgi:methylmalonyl-CoA/ethylmalonyl-CoA epimerase
VPVERIHHVAFAVENLDDGIETYERLYGASVELRGRLDSQGVDASYLRLGRDRIELLAPTAEDTPVGRFLNRRGPGMHHVAFEVPDVGSAVQALASAGATLIDEKPRPGLGGHDVAFVHHESQHGVLIEVVSP